MIANDELGVCTFSIDGALCMVGSRVGCWGAGRTVEVVDWDERRMERFRRVGEDGDFGLSPPR